MELGGVVDSALTLGGAVGGREGSHTKENALLFAKRMFLLSSSFLPLTKIRKRRGGKTAGEQLLQFTE